MLKVDRFVVDTANEIRLYTLENGDVVAVKEEDHYFTKTTNIPECNIYLSARGVEYVGIVLYAGNVPIEFHGFERADKYDDLRNKNT